MQIVIDIDDNLYTRLFNNGDIDAVDMLKACVTIRKGTPLPKGHGRLIDADAFKKEVCTYQQTGCGDCKHSLCCPEDAPTIIEADKAESEG